MRTLQDFLCGLILAASLSTILTSTASAAETVWQTNYQAAQAKAKAENKLLLTAFIGSDWCPTCKKLVAEVFEKKVFAANASKRFVLVQVDFPHEKKLSNELKEQNNKLAKQYKIEYFPSVLILKPSGELIAHTGYSAGGPENYNKQLTDLVKSYQRLAGLRKRLPQVQGIDRAKLLDELIEGYNDLGNEIDEIVGWRKEIVALDADNKAGLRRKYEFRVYLVDAQTALANGKRIKAEAAIDKALALTYIGPKQIQRAAIVKAKCCVARTDFQASIDCLEKAIRAAPNGPDVGTLKDLLKQSEKRLEAKNTQKSPGKEVTQDQ